MICEEVVIAAAVVSDELRDASALSSALINSS
jgi:hypothetical protein